jgi:hypothetical protein
VRQFGSSLFDAVVAVGVLFCVPAAALNPSPGLIAAAVTMVGLVTARIGIERAKARRSS